MSTLYQDADGTWRNEYGDVAEATTWDDQGNPLPLSGYDDQQREPMRTWDDQGNPLPLSGYDEQPEDTTFE